MFIVILLFFSIQLKNHFYYIDLYGLDYWMFEILFVCYITYKIFEIPVYMHKKLAVGFIVIFCLTLKISSTIDIFRNEHEKKIYKDYTWVVPIGIIGFILLTLLRAYSFCKIKWLFDFKFISTLKLLFLYSSIGALICFISSIISSKIECVSVNEFSQIDLICKNNDTYTNTLYYDNFSIYFKNLWNNDNLLINIIRIILFIFEIFLSFMIRLYSLLIIKKLSPEYFICSNSIVHFFTKIVTKFTSLFTKEIHKNYSLSEIIAEFFSIIAIIFYLELIELKFCGLNYNLKKNITSRCLEDSMSGLEEDFDYEDNRISEL